MTQSTYQILKTQKIINNTYHQEHPNKETLYKFTLPNTSSCMTVLAESESYTYNKQMHTAKLQDIMQSMQMRSLNRFTTILP